MNKEIERKFLVNKENVPQEFWNNAMVHEIQQVYLKIDGVESRVRKMDNRFYYTIKKDTLESPLVRDEDEKEITAEQFRNFSENFGIGEIIWKTRYTANLYNKKIELDVYKGELSGLVVAEIEFESKDEAKRFTPPVWFFEEVTYNKNYANFSLATKGLPAGNLNDE